MSSRRTDVIGVLRYPIRVPLEAGGGFVTKWWNSMNTPVLGPDGEVALIIHRTEDVTEIVRLRSQSEAHDQLLRDQEALINRLRATEGTLRRNHERQEFLLKLSDALRLLDHPTEVQAAACNLLAQHLHVDRVFFVEINAAEGLGFIGPNFHRDDLTSLSGLYGVRDLIVPRVETGVYRVFALPDISTAAVVRKRVRNRLCSAGIGALASAAVVKNGKLVLTLNAATKFPRNWPEEELTLIQEVSERASGRESNVPGLSLLCVSPRSA